jgi:hypothetical protein
MIMITQSHSSKIDLNSPKFQSPVEVLVIMETRSILPVTCRASPDQIIGADESDLYPPHLPSILYLRDQD